jgi:hypothetical protein
MNVKGNQILGLVRKSGDTLTQDADGTWHAESLYTCRWDDVIHLAPLRNVAIHPDFPQFICNGCQVRRLTPGDFCELRVTYRGFIGNAFTLSQDRSKDEISSGLSEEPIETHPLFVSTLAGTLAAPLNDAEFNSDGSFKQFKLSSKYAGVKSYKVPTVVYRSVRPADSAPGDIGEVGTIQDAPVAAPGSRNWLYAGKTWSRDGGVYTVNEEWILSGPRGWDSDIYVID